jgi:hypothetical protein
LVPLKKQILGTFSGAERTFLFAAIDHITRGAMITLKFEDTA